jgi:His/Glu/Gln/Arg/opine family amino acid ABC transporter permease subunit
VQLTLVAMVGGIVLGTLLALMRLSGKKWLVVPAAAYVNTMRSIPLVMVILWFFLLIPLLVGKPLGAELSAMSPSRCSRRPTTARSCVPASRACRGPGACRLRGGHDLQADHAASSCCRRPFATCCRCC